MKAFIILLVFNDPVLCMKSCLFFSSSADGIVRMLINEILPMFFQVVKREICSLVTKGTLTDGEMLSAYPEASYLMAVTAKCLISENSKTETCFGVCLVDAATSKITLGQVCDHFSLFFNRMKHNISSCMAV